MTDRKLLQQVLDALDSDNPDIQLRSAVALRNRMSQLEPLFSTPDVTPHVIDCPRCGHCCPQPEQEPVKDRLDFWALFDETQRLRAELKFNTTPPQRPWFGLTEEEIKECFTITPDLFLPWHIYARIEAKLKEKNNG
jgi:hypothetical protein